MRRPFIAGNWKLNLGPTEAAALATKLHDALADRGTIDVALFPTAFSVNSVLSAVKGADIHVGPQHIHAATSGAFTGENSATTARAMGCTYTLVGHSERRQLFGETDEQTNAKVKTAFSSGLIPMLCIGETLAQRDAGEIETVLETQLTAGLHGLEADQVATLTLAYEPVWAIGTGRTASPQQAQDAHAFIRGWLSAHYPAFVAEQTRILYGGSVKPSNAKQLLQCEDIDGALVGGASLKCELFSAIVSAAK